MSASEKFPFGTSIFEPQPEPTLTERIAEALGNGNARPKGIQGLRSVVDTDWLDSLPARVGAALTKAADGGFVAGRSKRTWAEAKADILLAALPALSTPPEEGK